MGVLCTKGLGFCANYPIIEEQTRSTKQKGKESFFTALSFGQREWSWAEQATQFNLRILWKKYGSFRYIDKYIKAFDEES